MKAKINLEKFICSYVKYNNIQDALKDQGLKCWRGEIVEIPQESEDERIKKEILDLVSISGNGNQFEEIKDWLEKQGQKSLIEEKSPAESLGISLEEYNEMANECIYGESTDKFKPKFKVGDWVKVSTTKGDKVVQIASVEYFKNGYPSYTTTEGRWFGNGTKARLLTDKDMETIILPESKFITCKDKEKQGEQKPTKYTLEQAAHIFLDALSDTPYNNSPITDAQVITNELLKFLANTSSYNPNTINEQKPVDKVEPKFKPGDWITNGKYTWKIVEVKPLDYILQSQDENIVDDTISYVDEQFHSFTIQDAKDGDVLATQGSVFIFKHLDKTGRSLCKSYCEVIDNSGLGLGFEFSINGVCPATKEQRDLLFNKMEEAGYEWDAEKRELKKIEQELVKEELILSELSFHKIQDILKDLGLINENGRCFYTPEEIFRAGLKYSIGRDIKEVRV